MSGALREQTLAYLEGHNVMTLATRGREGPWAAAVFYVNEGFTLNFLSAPHTRHCSDIAADGQVAGAIHEDYGSWVEIKGIQFEGHARRISGSAHDAAVARYQHKFPFTGGGAAGQVEEALGGVAWYEVTLHTVYLIDNSKGLGHREQVPLR